MPPPPGIAWPFFCGSSATMASVVMSRPATDAAPCSAARTTLVGSMMPFGHHVDVLARLRVEAVAILILLQDLSDDDGAVLACVEGNLASRRADRLTNDLHTRPSGHRLRPSASPAPWWRADSATPPPGRMPSSTAARVACIASSTRSLRSFTSISVAPPTRITATPPASLARRSCSFSLDRSRRWFPRSAP